MPSGATFKLNPQPVGNGFIWDGDKFHLTYAGHIELARVLYQGRQATTMPFHFSWVQENSEEGYEHTHVGLLFKARIRLVGAHKFDIRMVAGEIAPSGPLRAWHPNVQKITITQAEVIWNHYHYGRKFSKRQNAAMLHFTKSVWMSDAESALKLRVLRCDRLELRRHRDLHLTKAVYLHTEIFQLR